MGSEHEDVCHENDRDERSKIPANHDDAASVATFNSVDADIIRILNTPLANVPSPMKEERNSRNVLHSDSGIDREDAHDAGTHAENNQARPESDAELECRNAGSSDSLNAPDDAQSSEKNVSSKSVQIEKNLESSEELVLEDLPYTCFTHRQVFLIFAIVIYIGFLGPMAGNIYIPALPLLQREFYVDDTTINSTVSVFMGVFSVGPLFWGMFADFAGRKFLYVASLLLLLVVNILLATVPSNIGALFVLRIFQAFGSSSVIALGTGTVSDISPPKNRGKAIAYFMMGPNMGPILAPIVSGLILIRGDNWRWLFGFTSIMSGIALLLVLALLPETLRCIVGNGDQRWKKSLRKKDSTADEPQDTAERVGETVDRPKIKLFQNIGMQKPVNSSRQFRKLYPKPPKPSLTMYWHMIKFLPLTVSSLSTALLFASYYAFSVTFARFLQSDYNLSMLAVGAAYVCPGVAMLLGSQIGGHLSDYLRKRWLLSHEGLLYPLEYRLILQIWGIIINTAGCIGYGWSIQRHYPLVVVLVFSALNAFGLTWCSNTTMTYISELMAKRTAGAIAVSSFFRNVGATISSAIISKLYLAMGVGWCFSGLGLCNLISLAAILYLIKYGNHFHQEFNA